MADSRGTITICENFRFYNLSGHRFKLQFYNVTLVPANPTHERLLKKNWYVYRGDPPPFPGCVDGTYGDRDWLFTTFALLRDRVWIHYIPTPNMWATPPVKGWEFAPIFITLTESNDRTWTKATRSTGFIPWPLRQALKSFYDDGLKLANKLLIGATKWGTLPLAEGPLFWEGLDKTGGFVETRRRFYGMQRLVAELWGWVFLQEKLQGLPVVQRKLLKDTAIKLDYFRGAIIPWGKRNDDIAEMFLSHGVPTIWIDYIEDPKSHQAPWEGLPGRGHEALILHRRSGYDSVENDKAMRRKVYLLEVESVEEVPKVFSRELEAWDAKFLPSPAGPTDGQFMRIRPPGAAPTPLPNQIASTSGAPTSSPSGSGSSTSATPMEHVSLARPTPMGAPAAANTQTTPVSSSVSRQSLTTGNASAGQTTVAHVAAPYANSAAPWTYGNTWPAPMHAAPAVHLYAQMWGWGGYASQLPGPFPHGPMGPYGYPGVSPSAYPAAPINPTFTQPGLPADALWEPKRAKTGTFGGSVPRHRRKQRRKPGMNPTSAERLALKNATSAEGSEEGTSTSASTPNASPLVSVMPLANIPEPVAPTIASPSEDVPMEMKDNEAAPHSPTA
ncbi:hypothetical protein BOTBODRAFT_181967 [Botryobasidium botryosum FD-172 SS1]|uniref:Uncharacterized protein n=1 Tax=Botryobasidium botryosum (strain FD-172 SS1) TaxID=930990 RepID=A0A067M2C8_BOTB1|nr:hypothetical protein BOTBODRAFT_181967 [Botryobasidium botryosum FD-172 SS1]